MNLKGLAYCLAHSERTVSDNQYESLLLSCINLEFRASISWNTGQALDKHHLMTPCT